MQTVIVLSGGMDSGVLLAELDQFKNEADSIHAITFNYGSKHNEKEIACSKKLCAEYDVSQRIIELPFISELYNSSLLKGGVPIPNGHYKEESMRSTVVPFRNGIMLSIAAGYADTIGAKYLVIGSHTGDHFIYPDCRPDFNSFMKEAVLHGTTTEVLLKFPYQYINKRRIGLIGEKIGFNFKNTWTCYKGGTVHCGKCGACTERKEALKGFDTTKYQ